ncbi:MAG: ROK family protein [Balneolaceae bacterium]
MDLVAGIDLGATQTKFGLVNRKGELFAYQSIPTDTSVSYEEFFFTLSQKIKKLDVPVNGDFNITGVGVGTPTGNYIHGTIENASNLNWPDHIPVAKLLENYFSLPVSVCNDANAAAIGELMFGVAKGKKNFICITLGTGLGSGIVLDGKVVLGKEGHAGELGHITAVPEGRDCACGRKGCLETYASATGIVRTVIENSESELKKSLLYKDKDNLDARIITSAASQGDEIALQAFDDTGKILGRKLADVVAILNTELIILSGGLAKSGELIRKPVIKYMNEHLLNIFQGSVEVKLSEISSKNTSILGTAAFMWLKIENMSTLSTSTA